MMAAMVALVLLLTAVMAGSTGGSAQVKPDPDLGISEGLARERAARVSNLRYDLAFTIPAARTQPIRGRALIRFTLESAGDPLVLDYLPDRAGILRSVEANGVTTTIRFTPATCAGTAHMTSVETSPRGT